jgi:hypothetical protein
VVFAFLLVCGVSAFAQDLNVNGNVNLLDWIFAYQIHGNNVLQIYQTATNGSNLYVGRGAGVLSKPAGEPNTFLGNFAGNNFAYGDGSTAVGYAAGSNNVLGAQDTYIGYKAAGYYQTGYLGGKPSGSENTFVGYKAGFYNTDGSYNTFLGKWAGYYNTIGKENVYIGQNAGPYIKSGSYNIYLGTVGPTGNESGTIRIGDIFKQGATYMSGIYGASTTGGSVVYVDANGKLGTSPGSSAVSEMPDRIRSLEQRNADLEQRLARLEAERK